MMMMMLLQRVVRRALEGGECRNKPIGVRERVGMLQRVVRRAQEGGAATEGPSTSSKKASPDVKERHPQGCVAPKRGRGPVKRKSVY